MPFTIESVLRASHSPMGSTIECAEQASRSVSWSGSQHQMRNDLFASETPKDLYLYSISIFVHECERSSSGLVGIDWHAFTVKYLLIYRMMRF